MHSRCHWFLSALSYSHSLTDGIGRHWDWDCAQVKRRFRILAIKAIFREEIMAYCVAYRRVMASRFPEHHQTSDSTRMSDLFHKNDRTEHYKWKLELMYPTTEQEALNVRKVARMVTQWIAVWKRRKAERQQNLAEVRARTCGADPARRPPSIPTSHIQRTNTRVSAGVSQRQLSASRDGWLRIA